MDNSKNKEIKINGIRKKLKKHKIWLVLAVIYTLSPIDFLPDILPVIGMIDDMGFWIAQVLALMNTLSKKYNAMKDGTNQVDDSVLEFKKDGEKYKMYE